MGEKWPIYLGAAEYAAGSPVALEDVIADQALCAKLRSNGIDQIPCWDGDILELVHAAARQSLSDKRDAAEIDAVFLISNGLDAQNNLDAAWVGRLSEQLGLTKAAHYQVGMAGCAGFHWAAKLASALIEAEQFKHVLLVSFDKASGALQRLYDAEGDFPYVTGDAAAACILSASPDALGYRLLGKVANAWDGAQILRPSLEAEISRLTQLFEETFSRAGLRPPDIDLLITNNYSLVVSKLYGQVIGIRNDKVFKKTISTHAHCFSSDNIININHACSLGEIKAGNRLMLFSSGPFQWGACLLEKI